MRSAFAKFRRVREEQRARRSAELEIRRPTGGWTIVCQCGSTNTSSLTKRDKHDRTIAVTWICQDCQNVFTKTGA